MNILIDSIARNYNAKRFIGTNADCDNKNSKLKYSKNLVTDTVSFTGTNDERKCKKNSEKIFFSIAANDFSKAYQDAQNLSNRNNGWLWNPNYIGVNPSDNKERSMVGLLLRKLAASKNQYDNNVILDMLDLIISHEDYMPINPDNDDDYIKMAINTLKKEPLLAFLDSNVKYSVMLPEDNFDEYIACAKSKNQTEIVNKLVKMKDLLGFESEAKQNSCDDKRFSPVEEEALKKQLKLRDRLKQYKVLPLENDPKSLDDVGGMFKAKNEIKEFIIRPWDHRFRDRISENRLNRPSGFLLSGPPGCGKTYIMKAISAETGYNLYEVNLANIGDSYAYKTQSNLQELFDTLEDLYKTTDEPNILVLDEFDSIAMSRQNIHTDWKKDDVNALLMQLNNSSQKGIIVVAATNNPKDLDEAVRRPGRLDRQITIDKPDDAERRDILNKLLRNKPIAKLLMNDIDTMVAMTKDMSPAEISAIVNSTCLHAIYGAKDYAEMSDFKVSCEKIKSNAEVVKTRKIAGFKLD